MLPSNFQDKHFNQIKKNKPTRKFFNAQHFRSKIKEVAEKLSNVNLTENNETDNTVVYDHGQDESTHNKQVINIILDPERGDFLNISPKRSNKGKIRFSNNLKTSKIQNK